jgi:hypothetical protein
MSRKMSIPLLCVLLIIGTGGCSATSVVKDAPIAELVHLQSLDISSGPVIGGVNFRSGNKWFGGHHNVDVAYGCSPSTSQRQIIHTQPNASGQITEIIELTEESNCTYAVVGGHGSAGFINDIVNRAVDASGFIFQGSFQKPLAISKDRFNSNVSLQGGNQKGGGAEVNQKTSTSTSTVAEGSSAKSSSGSVSGAETNTENFNTAEGGAGGAGGQGGAGGAGGNSTAQSHSSAHQSSANNSGAVANGSNASATAEGGSASAEQGQQQASNSGAEALAQQEQGNTNVQSQGQGQTQEQGLQNNNTLTTPQPPMPPAPMNPPMPMPMPPHAD